MDAMDMDVEASPMSAEFLENLHDPALLTKPLTAVEEKWKLIPAFLQTRGLVQQHIESYNHFLDVGIKTILRTNNTISLDEDRNFVFKYLDIRIGEPSVEDNMHIAKVTPHQCRLRDITYSAPIYVDIEHSRGDEIVMTRNFQIGRMPVMLKSKACVLHDKNETELATLNECPVDPGGYFVVKGAEKVILIMEQLSKNRIIIARDNKGLIKATVTSSTHERKSMTSLIQKNDRFYLKINSFGNDNIPIVIVLKAMGCESDLEIQQLVGADPQYRESMTMSFSDCHEANVHSQDEALEYLGARINKQRKLSQNRTKAEEARLILKNILLIHIECVNYDFRKKSIYVTQMLRRMIQAATDPKKIDDTDYYGNKRLEMAGQMLALLFEDVFKHFNDEMKKRADSNLKRNNLASEFDVLKCLPTSLITNTMITSLSTGNWRLKRFRMDRGGVTQVLSRLSFIAALGMMTRIQSQFEKTRKVSGPRALQPSQWGVLCPSDTPEGESCGLVKNLAILAIVTIDEDEEPILAAVFDQGVESEVNLNGEAINSLSSYLVYFNGRIIGIHHHPSAFVVNMRALRRSGAVSNFVSVFKHDGHRAIYISSDAGRLCRPLIIVERARSLVQTKHIRAIGAGTSDFETLVAEGLIEYLDVNEENDCRIAMYDRDVSEVTTHLEIDPLTILGCVAGLIPYPHHNQSPRNTYQCAMGKQAMGNMAYNQLNRIDTLLYLLVYPMKPMVKTKILDLIGFERLGAGHNAMVAVMSYSGYDIEDAIVLNKSSVDRGYGRCIIFKKHKTVLKKYPNGTQDTIDELTEDDLAQAHNVNFDADGIVSPGTKIEPRNNVIVLKQSPANTTEDMNTLLDSGASVRAHERISAPNPIFIDQVLLTEGADDLKIIKTLYRETRRPELGDKFSSRHGQKGVVGLIVNQEDLPFNDKGMCPDMIMNPHGFPSRMTVGKLLEFVSGKAALLDGRFGDGTVFGGDPLSEISANLIRHGYNYSGKDFFTSGITGEPLQSYIFYGPVYYQKLKHMVADKMHARAKGPKASLTRQPTEGRSRDGGLRLGEMERDCLIGYGTSQLLLERLMISSDKFTAYVCETCGLMCYQGWCHYCRSATSISTVRIPYGAKLLFQELQSMNIVPRLTLAEH